MNLKIERKKFNTKKMKDVTAGEVFSIFEDEGGDDEYFLMLDSTTECFELTTCSNRLLNTFAKPEDEVKIHEAQLTIKVD